MKKLLTICTCAMALTANAAVFDDFSGTFINPEKWLDSDSWRTVGDGKLSMGHYIVGSKTSSQDGTGNGLGLSTWLTKPAKSISATIKVTKLDVTTTCPDNPTLAHARARIDASYFNVRSGGSVAGDRTGDVYTQLRIGRKSDSVDPVDTLKIEGLVYECLDTTCGSGKTATIGSIIDLGSTTIGTPIKIKFLWDKKNKSFSFIRDGVTYGKVTYVQADNIPPVSLYSEASVRVDVPNCMLPTVTPRAGVQATFDNITIQY
jgi:hypothetical protein